MPRSVVLCFLLCACGDNAFNLYHAEPEAFRTVTVWVEPHPDVPADLAREACEAWRPEGVLCELAASSEEALIRIRAFTGPCEKREDGMYPLGWATEGGDVTLMIECLRKFGGTPVGKRVLWPVISHEVGHELGVWTHVPTGCEDPEVMTHPELGPVCGAALMNPSVHDGLYGITVIDHAAYDLRDVDHSVLRLAADGCVLTAAE